jgi:type IV secretion system protein VirB5
MCFAIFSPRSPKQGKPSSKFESPETYNPYLAARRDWDERYGDQIRRAHNWRALAFACSVIALVATAGVVWISARSRIVPFVVVTDNLGRPVASGLADQASSADEQFKRFVRKRPSNHRLDFSAGLCSC